MLGQPGAYRRFVGRCQAGRARKHPQVLALGFADHGVAPVVGELDDPVRAPDRQPAQPARQEAHLQLRRLQGIAADLGPRRAGQADDALDATFGVAAAVDDLHPFRQPAVGGGRVGETLFLEAVGVPRDLVPGAHVARHVERRQRAQWWAQAAVSGGGPEDAGCARAGSAATQRIDDKRQGNSFMGAFGFASRPDTAGHPVRARREVPRGTLRCRPGSSAISSSGARPFIAIQTPPGARCRRVRAVKSAQRGKGTRGDHVEGRRLQVLDAACCGVKVRQRQRAGHLSHEGGLLANGVDAGHVPAWEHGCDHHARQAPAAAHVQQPALPCMALQRRDHRQAVGQMLGQHGRAIAHGREVVGGVPALQQVEIAQQRGCLRLARRQPQFDADRVELARAPVDASGRLAQQETCETALLQMNQQQRDRRRRHARDARRLPQRGRPMARQRLAHLERQRGHCAVVQVVGQRQCSPAPTRDRLRRSACRCSRRT